MIHFINYPFELASPYIGASPDELKLIFCILLSYPFAGVLKRLPDSQPAIKNIFMIGVSLFYLVGIFDLWGGVRTFFISAAGAYLISANVKGPLMPWIGFIFLMGHMSVSHIERQITARPGKVDITGAQMVLVMKLTAFCWNVYDGRFPDSELSDFQRDRAIKEMPGLLDYAAYVLYFPSLFAGPSFDFNEYRRWIDLSMFDVEVLDKKGALRKRRRIPRSGRPAAKKAIAGLIWIGIFSAFLGSYNVKFGLSDGFLQYGILRRIWYVYVVGFIARCKYYGVWFLSEGACILSGLGYNGLDEKKRIRWDRLQNVDAWDLELGQNSRALFEAWNKNTNKWLRYYVYLRVTPKGKKPGFRSSMATFMTSALWHGFYPGYYLAFLTGSFVQTVAKYFRRYVRPFFMTPDGTRPTEYKIYYDIFSMVVTQAAFGFMALPFIILTFKDSLVMWSRVWFYDWVGIALIMAVFNSPLKGIINKQLKARSAGVKAPETKVTKITENGADKPVPFGIPDEDLVRANVGEALQEIQELKERRKNEKFLATGSK